MGRVFEVGFLVAREIRARGQEELALEQTVQGACGISFSGLRVWAEEAGKELGPHSQVPSHFGVQ